MSVEYVDLIVVLLFFVATWFYFSNKLSISLFLVIVDIFLSILIVMLTKEVFLYTITIILILNAVLIGNSYKNNLKK